MKRKPVVLFLAVVSISVLAAAPGFGQNASPGVAKQVRDNFIDVDRKILDMARDWPAENYDYKLRKEMRSFGAVLVHLASGNVYAAKIGRGEKAKWDELDPAKYPDKAAVVALLEQSFSDSRRCSKGCPTRISPGRSTRG